MKYAFNSNSCEVRHPGNTAVVLLFLAFSSPSAIAYQDCPTKEVVAAWNKLTLTGVKLQFKSTLVNRKDAEEGCFVDVIYKKSRLRIGSGEETLAEASVVTIANREFLKAVTFSRGEGLYSEERKLYSARKNGLASKPAFHSHTTTSDQSPGDCMRETLGPDVINSEELIYDFSPELLTPGHMWAVKVKKTNYRFSSQPNQFIAKSEKEELLELHVPSDINLHEFPQSKLTIRVKSSPKMFLSGVYANVDGCKQCFPKWSPNETAKPDDEVWIALSTSEFENGDYPRFIGWMPITKMPSFRSTEDKRWFECMFDYRL